MIFSDIALPLACFHCIYCRASFLSLLLIISRRAIFATLAGTPACRRFDFMLRFCFHLFSPPFQLHYFQLYFHH